MSGRKQIQGAIFDMDGTLLDSMEIWQTIAADYLRTLGIQPAENLSGKVRDLSMEQAAALLKSDYDLPFSEKEIIKGVNSLLADFYRKHVRLRPGMKKLLLALKERDVKICAATATDAEVIETALKRLGVSELFEFVLTCGQAGAGKDQPDIYEQALLRLGTSKAQTFVFEDALYALQTAKQAGFPTVAVAECHQPDQDKIRQNCTLYISDPGAFDAFDELFAG